MWSLCDGWLNSCQLLSYLFFSIAVRLSVKRKSDSSKKDKRRKWLLRWSGLEWHKTVIQRWGNRFEKRGVLLMWLYMPVAELLLFFTNICGILWPEIGQSSGENLIFMCMDLWELCAGYLVDVKRIYCSVTHTHTRLTAFFRDYPGEPVPER